MSSVNPERASPINPRNFWYWFGGIWLTVGVPFLVIGGYAVWNELTLEQRFARAGERAQGMVLVKRWDRGSDGKYPSFHVRYRFTTSEGRTVDSESEVSEQAWEALRERQPASVSYLSDSPRTNRIEGWVPQRLMPAIFCGLGAIITLLGGFVVLKAISGARFERRMREQGLTTAAEVFEVAPTGYMLNRVRQWKVHYRYRDHAGIEHEGRSPSMSPEQAQRWHPGDRVKIRFDRLRPGRSAWTGEQ